MRRYLKSSLSINTLHTAPVFMFTSGSSAPLGYQGHGLSCSNEGLTLETSARNHFHGVKLIHINLRLIHCAFFSLRRRRLELVLAGTSISWFISLTVATYHVQYIFLSLCQSCFSQENGRITKILEVHHFLGVQSRFLMCRANILVMLNHLQHYLPRVPSLRSFSGLALGNLRSTFSLL